MGIDPDTGSQMEERARRAEACKVRARRLEMVLGERTEDVLKALVSLVGFQKEVQTAV